MDEPRIRRRLVCLAEAVIASNENLLAGCRLMYGTYTRMEAVADEIFLPITAFVSDADHFPPDSVRPHFAPEYLARLDQDLASFEMAARDEIMAACKAIVDKFGEAD